MKRFKRHLQRKKPKDPMVMPQPPIEEPEPIESNENQDLELRSRASTSLEHLPPFNNTKFYQERLERH
jgi:hypothetical protein